MNKKKRYCKHPNCGKPIWHKGSPDFTTGNYCEEHRKPKYRDERKRIADAERQRKKRKGMEKATRHDVSVVERKGEFRIE